MAPLFGSHKVLVIGSCLLPASWLVTPSLEDRSRSKGAAESEGQASPPNWIMAECRVTDRDNPTSHRGGRRLRKSGATAEINQRRPLRDAKCASYSALYLRSRLSTIVNNRNRRSRLIGGGITPA